MDNDTIQEISKLVDRANEKQLKLILDFFTRLSKTFT